MKRVATLVTFTTALHFLSHSARAENQPATPDTPSSAVTQPKTDASQPKESQGSADELFRQGVLLMKSDNCPEAIVQFQRSQELDPSGATLLNLATCYVRLGRTGSAWRAYRQAAEAAKSEGDDDLGERAFRAMSIIAPRLTQ